MPGALESRDTDLMAAALVELGAQDMSWPGDGTLRVAPLRGSTHRPQRRTSTAAWPAP